MIKVGPLSCPMPASPGLMFGGRGGVWGDSDLGLGLFGRPGFPLEKNPQPRKKFSWNQTAFVGLEGKELDLKIYINKSQANS